MTGLEIITEGEKKVTKRDVRINPNIATSSNQNYHNNIHRYHRGSFNIHYIMLKTHKRVNSCSIIGNRFKSTQRKEHCQAVFNLSFCSKKWKTKHVTTASRVTVMIHVHVCSNYLVYNKNSRTVARHPFGCHE